LGLSFLEQVQRWLSDPPPDHFFEIAEYSLAASSPRDGRQQKRERLTERGLTAAPNGPNVTKPQLYSEALPRVVQTQPGRRPTAALVIPDYAARMAILDFEEFPASETEAMALLRFRLRKSVPFHIEEAQVSYAVQLEQPGRVEVLAVAIAQPVLEEYESIFVNGGYRVGLVLPSSIATLPLCNTTQKGITLLAKSAGSTLSVLLVQQESVRLVRCLDLTSEDLTSEEEAAGLRGQPVVATVLPLLQQTLAFAEDQLGEPVRRILLSGFGEENEKLGYEIERDFGIHAEELRSRFGKAERENAGVMGLLERYAA
jgi:type IV pilus assembly protein PilM